MRREERDDVIINKRVERVNYLFIYLTYNYYKGTKRSKALLKQFLAKNSQISLNREKSPVFRVFISKIIIHPIFIIFFIFISFSIIFYLS